MYKALQTKGTSLENLLYSVSTLRIQEGKLKPVNPDRLIVLSKLMDMDKKSQRYPLPQLSSCFSLCGGMRREKVG